MILNFNKSEVKIRRISLSVFFFSFFAGALSIVISKQLWGGGGVIIYLGCVVLSLSLYYGFRFWFNGVFVKDKFTSFKIVLAMLTGAIFGFIFSLFIDFKVGQYKAESDFNKAGVYLWSTNTKCSDKVKSIRNILGYIKSDGGVPNKYRIYSLIELSKSVNTDTCKAPWKSIHDDLFKKTIIYWPKWKKSDVELTKKTYWPTESEGCKLMSDGGVVDKAICLTSSNEKPWNID